METNIIFDHAHPIYWNYSIIVCERYDYHSVNRYCKSVNFTFYDNELNVRLLIFCKVSAAIRQSLIHHL